jgi:histidinol-phosphate aminotransferase
MKPARRLQPREPLLQQRGNGHEDEDHGVSISTQPYQIPANEHNAVMLHLNENLLLDDTMEQALVRGLTPGDLHRYPPGGDHLLRQAAAEVCGVRPEAVLPSAGAAHAIQHLLLRFVPVFRHVILPSPTWTFYATCIAPLGGRVLEAPLRDDGARFAYDVAAIDRLLSIQGEALVMLATPNNPTGNSLPYDDILRVAQRHPHCVFMVDEAYFGFGEADPQAAARCLQRLDNVIVIRSLSKVYGLAGVRCGFALAPGNIRDAIAGLFLPFGLPIWVQTVAARRLHDATYLSRIRARCHAGQSALREALAGCRSVWVYDSDANFCLIRGAPGQAAEWVGALESAGYIVKHVNDCCLRVTIAAPDVMRRVARILCQVEGMPCL